MVSHTNRTYNQPFARLSVASVLTGCTEGLGRWSCDTDTPVRYQSNSCRIL